MRGKMKGHWWWTLVFGLGFFDNEDFSKKLSFLSKNYEQYVQGTLRSVFLLSFGIFISKWVDKEQLFVLPQEIDKVP
jgi:hypothetical protein